MKEKKQQEYQHNYDVSNQQIGIVKVGVRIPECRRLELLALAEKWRQEVQAKPSR